MMNKKIKEPAQVYYDIQVNNYQSVGSESVQMRYAETRNNRIIKNSIGKTAKEYIQSRLTTEAKRLLYFSNLSNKEIGFELGFNEPAHFSAFFKKCTQLSPSNFKKK